MKDNLVFEQNIKYLLLIKHKFKYNIWLYLLCIFFVIQQYSFWQVPLFCSDFYCRNNINLQPRWQFTIASITYKGRDKRKMIISNCLNCRLIFPTFNPEDTRSIQLFPTIQMHLFDHVKWQCNRFFAVFWFSMRNLCAMYE